METGAGLARAASALVETKCDLANMSYGEASAIPDYGHFVELIRDEVIGKYGCIFVASAGNAGPALSTSGSPGSTTSGKNIIIIFAIFGKFFFITHKKIFFFFRHYRCWCLCKSFNGPS
jgi:hypothetical protein